MPDPVWYKSLYWRIAFGFVAMLAALLLAQSLVIVWLTDRVVGWSSQSPEELVSSVAANLSTALARNPDLALDAYVRDEFSGIYRPFVVAMLDGRVVSNRPNGLPPSYPRAVQQRLRRGAPLNDIDPGDGGRDRGPDGGRGRGPGWRDRGPDGSRDGPGIGPPPIPDGGPGGTPDGRPRRGSASAAILAGDKPVGFVVIPINPPPTFVAIRELGPTLIWVGLVLLGIGAASAALLIFSPAHRRLRTLEHAARALGEGRTETSRRG